MQESWWETAGFIPGIPRDLKSAAGELQKRLGFDPKPLEIIRIEGVPKSTGLLHKAIERITELGGDPGEYIPNPNRGLTYPDAPIVVGVYHLTRERSDGALEYSHNNDTGYRDAVSGVPASLRGMANFLNASEGKNEDDALMVQRLGETADWAEKEFTSRFSAWANRMDEEKQREKDRRTHLKT